MRGLLKTLLWFSPRIICASFPLRSPPSKMCHIPLHKFGYAKLPRRVLRQNMLQSLSSPSHPFSLPPYPDTSLSCLFRSFPVCPCRGKCSSLTLRSCLEYPLPPNPIHAHTHPDTHTLRKRWCVFAIQIFARSPFSDAKRLWSRGKFYHHQWQCECAAWQRVRQPSAPSPFSPAAYLNRAWEAKSEMHANDGMFSMLIFMFICEYIYKFLKFHPFR